MGHFNEVFADSKEQHTFRTIEPKELEAWLTVLAKEYVALRTATETELTPISVKGLGLFDTAALEKLLGETLIPEPGTGSLSVTRSDLSEMASYLILEDEYHTQIGFKLIRDRELINAPGRGVDVIGVEERSEENLNLVLTEVKFSDESKAPPQVVQPGNDSLKKQHEAHLKEKNKTFAKLMDCARKVRDSDVRVLYMQAALLFKEQKWDVLNLTYCSVLVRPEEKYKEEDFGYFKKKPESFDPAAIRFVILRLPGDITQILRSWHSAIKSEQDSVPESQL